MTEKYRILGVDESVTDEELTAKYEELVEKYRKDRFLVGEAGNEAAKRLTEVRVAYQEIMDYRHEVRDDTQGLYAEIVMAIKSKDLKLAQDRLDAVNDRSAEWHYLQSVVYFKKNWTNESKKQLEIAIEMDADNEKYKTAYARLNEKIEGDKQKLYSGEEKSYSGSSQPDQMGGDSCMDFCCRSAICTLLLNCCCNCG